VPEFGSAAIAAIHRKCSFPSVNLTKVTRLDFRAMSIMIQFVFIAALPTLFVGAASLLSWHQLSKPWLFVVLSTVILYLVYVMIFYLLPSRAMGFTLVENGPALDGVKSYNIANEKGDVPPSIIGQYIWHLLLFGAVAIPSLWFSVKLLAVKP
jgi:hypothetical protein